MAATMTPASLPPLRTDVDEGAGAGVTVVVTVGKSDGSTQPD
jgi:hypothetical protein